jgi:hypothetical protein
MNNKHFSQINVRLPIVSLAGKFEKPTSPRI